MRRNILLFFLTLISILTARAGDVNVTLTTYEYESRPAHVDVAAQNLAKLLTAASIRAASPSMNWESRPSTIFGKPLPSTSMTKKS